MSLQTQSFTQIVSNFASSVQSSAAALVNFTTGSVLRALAEANAAIALWLQGLVVTLLSTIRLSTASGTDVDSWLADFGFARLPATPASGLVTFARMTTTTQAIVPVGTVVQTGDGTQQYTIPADTTNAAYNATIISGGGFVIPAGVASINCKAVSITPGTSGVPDSAGNVSANTITSITSGIAYVDTVNNATAFTNGVNPETDTAVRARFVVWINSLAEGTLAAVNNAVASVQQGLNFKVIENMQYNGTILPGYFTVVVDDGTGSPTSGLLTAVANAVNPIRPLGSTFGVYGPQTVRVNVNMAIVTAPAYVRSDITALVQTAITNYINSLSIGQSLIYTRLAQVAYDASAAVTTVTIGYTVAGGNSDIVASNVAVIKAATVTVV